MKSLFAKTIFALAWLTLSLSASCTKDVAPVEETPSVPGEETEQPTNPDEISLRNLKNKVLVVQYSDKKHLLVLGFREETNGRMVADWRQHGGNIGTTTLTLEDGNSIKFDNFTGISVLLTKTDGVLSVGSVKSSGREADLYALVNLENIGTPGTANNKKYRNRSGLVTTYITFEDGYMLWKIFKNFVTDSAFERYRHDRDNRLTTFLGDYKGKSYFGILVSAHGKWGGVNEPAFIVEGDGETKVFRPYN